jgi:lysozyme
MMLSNDGLKFIASFEGYHKALPDGRCQAYRCIVGKDKNGRPIDDGKWTIGFGCTEGITEGLIWTRAQAEQAFREELSIFEAAVNRLVKVPISQNAFDALVSFSYNCGEGALSSSTLLKKLNKGDPDGAAREFGNWVNSNGVKKVPGLVRRRREETAVFLRPDKAATVAAVAATVPDMPQTVDKPTPMKAAMKHSWTVSGSIVLFVAWVVEKFNLAIQFGIEAVAELTRLEALKVLSSGLGITIAASTLTLVAIFGILGRRLYAAHAGKVG